jgi:hypothetical protein
MKLITKYYIHLYKIVNLISGSLNKNGVILKRQIMIISDNNMIIKIKKNHKIKICLLIDFQSLKKKLSNIYINKNFYIQMY